MNRAPLPRPAILAGFRLPFRLTVFTLASLFVASVPAQDDAGEPPQPSADGQAVDEEEAEFRRRMELEERPDDDRRSPADLPDIVEVDPAEAPEDHLPPSSRDHLEKQLTELIIENGRWEPADAEREAEFEPSDAARIDPELAAQEAEAWEAMVSAYHEREQAAWSGNSGNGGEPGETRQSAAGSGSGSGSSAGSGAGSGDGTGSGSGGGQGAGAEADRSAEPAGERAPTGEPFSALEFLGEADASKPEPDPTDPGAPEATPSANPGSAGEGPGERQDAGAPESTADPGRAAPGGEETGESDMPSGAVDPAVLGVLFPGESPESGKESGKESGEESGNPPGPATPSGTGDPPNPAPGPTGGTSPSERPDPPLPAGAPPPEPSIWDWLRGLFGSEQEEEQAPEPNAAPG